jgi:large subunit ribosomal protein L30
MKKFKVTQIKSGIDRPERQKLTLKALGLTRMNSSREVEATPQILGMIRAVNHLIKVEEVSTQNIKGTQEVAPLENSVEAGLQAGSSFGQLEESSQVAEASPAEETQVAEEEPQEVPGSDEEKAGIGNS